MHSHSYTSLAVHLLNAKFHTITEHYSHGKKLSELGLHDTRTQICIFSLSLVLYVKLFGIIGDSELKPINYMELLKQMLYIRFSVFQIVLTTDG